MSATATAEGQLKTLQTRRSKALGQLDITTAELADVQRRHHELKAEVAKINAQIEQLTSQNQRVVVSEHAILQYLKRVKGLSMDSLRDEILDPETEKAIKTLKTGSFPSRCGKFKLKTKGGIVTTIIGKEEN